MRLLPLVGKEESLEDEALRRVCSNIHIILDQEFGNMKVPEVLVSGHHKNVKSWNWLKQKNNQGKAADLWDIYMSKQN